MAVTGWRSATLITAAQLLLAALSMSGAYTAFAETAEDPDLAALGIPANHRELSAITELWEPVPRKVTPGVGTAPPNDAIILFDGTDLSQWEPVRENSNGWQLDTNAMVVVPGSGNLRTRQSFEDVQLHIEWRSPARVAGDSQNRGNSGIFLMERYEVQVLDSFDNPTYPNGQAASVYKQHVPLVNASRGPGEWQSYDIVFMAPQFGRDGRVSRPATVTVFHNNVLVQNNVVLHGPTEYIGEPRYEAHGPAPIELQDHGAQVAYRNIWVRSL